MVGRRSEVKQRAPEWLAEHTQWIGLLVLRSGKVLRQCVFAQTHRSGIGAALPKMAALHSNSSVPQRGDLPCRRHGGAKHLGNRLARVVLHNILECVNNALLVQLLAPVETRHFVNDITTVSVANSEDDVTRSICSAALELRDEFFFLKKKNSEKTVKLTLSISRSLIVSNWKGLANRVQRILKVNDLHIPVADAARDLGIDSAGGGRRRRKTRNQRLRAARRRRKKAKVLARKNHKAVKLYTIGIWPSIAYGVEQYGLSPKDLKQFRSTAAA